MCRAHCHRIIKLSGTLGQFAPEKELIENVHGIRGSFLDSGKEVSKRIDDSPKADLVFGSEAEPSVYFIGKMLWSKGIGSLMDLLQYAEEKAGIKIKVDMYGGGPDREAAEKRADSLSVNMNFHGPIDHAELAFSHKVSLSLLFAMNDGAKLIGFLSRRFLSIHLPVRSFAQQLQRRSGWESLWSYHHTRQTTFLLSFQIASFTQTRKNLLVRITTSIIQMLEYLIVVSHFSNDVIPLKETYTTP
jgi:glycosyltransferase involved in cell wall biosynthesis